MKKPADSAETNPIESKLSDANGTAWPKGGWLFAMLFIAAISFIRTNLTAEPENTIRYLIFSLAVSITCIGLVFGKPASRFIIPVNGIVKFLIATLIVTALSLLMAFHKGDGLYELSKLLLQTGVFFLWIFLFQQSKNVLYPLVMFIMISFVVIASFALFQIAPQISSFGSSAHSSKLNDFLFSTFSNKNFFGEALLLMLPFLVAGALFTRGILRKCSIACALLCLILMLVIESLAVFVALLISVGVMAYLLLRYVKDNQPGTAILIITKKRKWILAGSVVVVALCAVLVFKLGAANSFITKIKTAYAYYEDPERMSKSDHELNDNSVYDRLLLYGNSVRMIAEYPVIGCGLTNWRILFPKYGISGSPYLDSGRLRYEHPHNEYLFILCETGIAGFVCWIGLLIAALLAIIRKIKNPQTEKRIKQFLILMAGGIVSFAIVSMFSYPRERFFTLFHFMLMLALVTYFTGSSNRKKIGLSKSAMFLFILLFASSTWMHAIHVRSELYLRVAQNRQLFKDFPVMLRYVKKAQTDLFPLDLTSTPLNWYRGMAHFYLGDSITALEFYRKAAEDNPYHIQVWTDLGAMFEKHGNYPEAIHAFHQALEINPVYPEAFYNAGITYYKAGNTDSALYYLDQYPHAHHRAYQKLMSEVLAYSVGEYAQKQHDTLLVNVLNDSIKADKFFLFKEYEAVSRNRPQFMQNLLELK